MTDAVSIRPAGRLFGLPLDPLNAASILLFTTFFVVMASRLWINFPPDLSALYFAGYFYSHGSWGLIYDYPPGFFESFPPSWESAAAQVGVRGKDTLPYVYPPLWAALIAPTTKWLDPYTFIRIFVLIELALMGLGAILAHRICRAFALPLWLWVGLVTGLFATSIISLAAMWHLQPQIIVAFLVLLAFERYSHGKSATAGTILAFAAALKIAPAAFALVFLLDRNWRAFGACVAVGLALLAASFAVGGVQLHLDFLDSVAAAGEGIFFTRITYTVELTLYALGMWAGYFPWVDTTEEVARILHTPLAVSVLTKVLFLGTLIWMVRGTRNLDDSRRLAARLILLTLVVNCFGPLGWSHYFVPLLMFLPGLVGLLSWRAGIALFALLAAVTSVPSQFWMRANLPGEIPVAVIHVALMAVLFIGILRSVRD